MTGGETPRRLRHDSPEIPAALALIRRAFAQMEGRIDPPSSVHRLTEASLRETCASAELWVMGDPPHAAAIFTRCADGLQIGKLAVDAAWRRRGCARTLLALAEVRARALGLPALTLNTRVELTENHAAFARLGFVEVGRETHSGYAAPTSIVFRRTVAAETPAVPLPPL